MHVLVVGTDLSPVSRHAFDSAVALARDLDASIVLVHAYDHLSPPATVPEETLAKFHEEDALDATSAAHRLTEQWAAEARKDDVEVEVIVRDERAPGLIIDVADEKDAAMIVVGTSRKGLVARTFLGSVAEEVVRTSRRPVLVIPIPT